MKIRVDRHYHAFDGRFRFTWSIMTSGGQFLYNSSTYSRASDAKRSAFRAIRSIFNTYNRNDEITCEVYK